MRTLDALVDWLLATIAAGNGWALAVVMLVENLFPPIPSEAVLPLAGYLVDQGTLTLWETLLLATAGSTVGAAMLYALGRWGGRPVLLRWHTVLRLDEDQLDRADDWFDQHGPKLVFWLRMVPLARSVISVPAGASEMPFLRFCALTAAGSALWNAVLVGAGVAVGRNWEAVAHTVSRFSTAAVIGLGLAAVAGALWWWKREPKP